MSEEVTMPVFICLNKAATKNLSDGLDMLEIDCPTLKDGIAHIRRLIARQSEPMCVIPVMRIVHMTKRPKVVATDNRIAAILIGSMVYAKADDQVADIAVALKAGGWPIVTKANVAKLEFSIEVGEECLTLSLGRRV